MPPELLGLMTRKIIAGLCLVVGVILITLGMMRDSLLSNKIEEAKQDVVTLTAEQVAENTPQTGNFDYSTLDAIDDTQVLNAVVSGTRMKAIGVLAIPSISVRLPIGYGLSFENMALGAGTLKPDQVMGQGNYALASHTLDNNARPDLLFGSLHTMTKGQTIYMTDMTNVYTYEVIESHEIEPTDVHVLDETDRNVITLITCTRNGDKRWYVRGKLVKVNPNNKATPEQLAAFEVEENAWYH